MRFLGHQLDYIFFFYGLAFILLAAVCTTMRRNREQRLPWLWIGLFGMMHGVNEWLEMLGFSVGAGRGITSIRLGVLAVSFVCLVEFGRQGLFRLRKRRIGAWIYAVLLLPAFSGILIGGAGLNATLRYVLGFIGGTWCAWTLSAASRTETSGRRSLFLASLLMFGYALAAGLVVQPAGFFPASVVNATWFFSYTGIPIQLMRGLLAVLIAASIWEHFQQTRRSHSPEISSAVRQQRFGLQLFVALVFIMTVGWVFTELVGRYENRERQDAFMREVRIAASMIDVGSSEEHAAILRLDERLAGVLQVNPGFRSVSVLVLFADGRIRTMVDIRREGNHPETPGGRPFNDSEIARILAIREPFILEPQDAGEMKAVLGFAPITGAPGEKPRGVLMIGTNADEWDEVIARARMMPVGVTLVIAVLFIAFFVFRQRVWEAAQVIAASEQRLRLHVQLTPLVVIEWDPACRVVRWNPTAESIFGYSPDEAIGRHAIFIVPPGPENDGEKVCRDLMKGERGERRTIGNIRKDGRIIQCEWYNTLLTGKNGKIIGIVSLVQDVTARKEAEEELRELSLVDHLTGLNNRRGFLTLATQQMKISNRLHKGFSLIYSDLDGMKWINDTYGHREGDRALVEVADILRETLRSSDAIARIGGDEFVGLLSETADTPVETILKRLTENVNAHNKRGSRPYEVSMSIGVARYDPENPCSLDELLESGDRLMYEEKDRRRRQRK